MPTVSVNGQTIKFPDSMTNEQIKSVLKKRFPSQQKVTGQGYIPEEKGVMDYARTALDQGLQGATFGFADEISDRIGAGIASLYTGLPYDEMLKEARSTTQDRLDEEMQEMPVTSLMSNIGGGLLTGGAGATTKTGATIGNFLRAGNKASRVAKGVVAGAASGGLYGAGMGEDGEKLFSAERGAFLGGSTGLAAPIAGNVVSGAIKGSKNIASGIAARSGEALDDVAKVLRSKSDTAYAKMREIGATLNGDTSRKLLNDLDGIIAGDGPINARLHDKTISLQKDLQSVLKKGDVGLEELDQWRQLLGQVASDYHDKPNARKAGLLIEVIDDAVDALQPSNLSNGSVEAIDALKAGRQAFKVNVKYRKITDLLKKADGDPNKIKSSLKRFLNDDKNLRGFTKDEVSALKDASRYTAPEGILKTLGKFGFDLGTSQTMGNTALPVLSGGLAAGALGPATGGAIPIAGTIARQGQKYLARGKAENLLRVIESGGKVPMKEIMALPPKEAQELLTVMKTMTMPNLATAVYQNQ